MSLGATLVGVALLAVLGVALATMGVTHTRLLTHSRNRTSVTNAARSVVEMAAAKVLENTLAPNETFVVDSDGVHAVLTFDEAQSTALGIPLSLSNLTGATAVWVPNAKVTVPAATVRLVGHAVGAGQTREVEAFLYIPPFPYAIASAGQIHAPNGLCVGEWVDSAYDTDPMTPVTPWGPADLGSNFAGTDSVVLGEQSRITGNVDSSGQVVIGPQAAIYGKLRANLPNVTVPQLDVTAYDPNVRGMTSTPYPGDGTILTGVHRHSGSLSVTGRLKLLNGFLYVDGDLDAQDGISGQGVVVANGAISIRGGVDFKSAGMDLAIVSRDHLALKGNHPLGAHPRNDSFHGVVYAGGGLDAELISIVGTLVAGAPDALVTLDKVAVIERRKEALPRPYVPRTLEGTLGLGSWSQMTAIPGTQYSDERQAAMAVTNSSDPMLKISLAIVDPGPPEVMQWNLQILKAGGLTATGTGTELQLQNSLTDAFVAQLELFGPNHQPLDRGTLARTAQSLARTVFAASEGLVDPVGAPKMNPALILNDLSTVLSMPDRMRILKWEER